MKIAEFLDQAIQITLKCQANAGSKMMKEFVGALESVRPELNQLKSDVHAFARSFPMPGFDTTGL